MRTTTAVAQIVVRLFGLILIILGLFFWSGHALQLVNAHMLIGLLFVIALWVLAGVAIAAHQSGGLIALGFIWGIVVLALGMTQRTLLQGSVHWVIQVLHLLVGLIAMGIGDNLAKRIKGATAAAP
ncbi:MAG TPA: hypothetical protein VN650_11180 [Gemmatimonadaceae bacterium]|nr:hypothetical protein [Gemmatimonadaceae bacterium]